MPLPPDTTLDDVKIRIREAYSNPNVGKISQVVLKDGPQTFRIATLLEIVNPKTGTLHHYSLKIDHIVRKKKSWAGSQSLNDQCALRASLLTRSIDFTHSFML